MLYSGEVERFNWKAFSDQCLYSQFLTSDRHFDIKNTSSVPQFFSQFDCLSCALVEPITNCGASLFFLSDGPCSLDASSLEKHIATLVELFCTLLVPKPEQPSLETQKAFITYKDLLNLNNNVPILIALVNKDLCYEFINDTYEQRFSILKDDVVGMHIQEHIPLATHPIVKSRIEEALQGKSARFYYDIRQGIDGEQRFIGAYCMPRIVDDEVTGLYLCMQDVTAQRKTLNTLQRLHEVTANSCLSLAEKLQRILQVGAEQFALPIGLISSINGDLYRVEYSHTPNGEVAPGDTFDLGNTYCVHTLKSDKPTSYFHTAISDIKEHPCYQNFGLEAYIGIVLYVGGKRWGTLNFSSPNPKKKAFGDDDYEVMKLLAQWVGNEMTHAYDRSVQAQYENELREQKVFFESLFVNAPEAIVLVDSHRRIKMINPAFTALFGYELEDLLDKTTQVLYAEESDFILQGKAYGDDVEDVLNRYRVRYKSKQGKIFHTETIGSMIPNADGSLGGFIAHIRDVTERLEVEQKMIDTNLRLSIAADVAGIGVWELDLDNYTLHWDEWMYRLYNSSRDEGDSPLKIWEECVFPDDRKRLAEVFVRSEEGGAYFSDPESVSSISQYLDTDFRIVRKDGQTRYLKSNATIIFDDDGNASRLVGVNMDITSRKETEVVLREASQQALAASKAKGNFLATMSHKIRTPLNGVLGMAELLSGSELNSEQKEQLRILKESGEGLLGLINDLLDFSKIEAGHLSIERVDFNLEKAIYDVVRLLMMKAEEKVIDLLVEYDESCPRFLVGDVFRIKQVLTNLISNAIKFTNSGHVLVSAKGAVDPQGLVAITMSITDTGVGIADHVQPQLFNAFVQADSSTTREFGGTGLGLAITKQLVDLMDGNISLSSKLGVGSVFTVTFALPESHAMSYIESVDDESLLLGKKALVVDDNETNLAILRN